MEVTLSKADIDGLAKSIVEYLWEDIPKEALPEKPKTVEEVVVEPVKELTAKKEASEPVKEDAAKPQITTAELRKAVMEFTRNSQDNLTKTKEILSGMGIEQLSQLEGDLITQFVEKFVAIGGKI